MPINVVTYDGSANGSNSFKTKIGLLDRAGSGWPDVVFSTQNNDAAWASQKTNGKQAFAAVLNKGLVPQNVLSGFTKGSLNPCTVDGKVYCLRNDLAQNVLWFNKTLMDQVRLRAAEELGGLPDPQREGGRAAPGLPHRLGR